MVNYSSWQSNRTNIRKTNSSQPTLQHVSLLQYHRCSSVFFFSLPLFPNSLYVEPMSTLWVSKSFRASRSYRKGAKMSTWEKKTRLLYCFNIYSLYVSVSSFHRLIKCIWGMPTMWALCWTQSGNDNFFCNAIKAFQNDITMMSCIPCMDEWLVNLNWVIWPLILLVSETNYTTFSDFIVVLWWYYSYHIVKVT